MILRRPLLVAAAAVVAAASTLAAPATATTVQNSSSLTVTVRWAPGVKDTWTLRCDPVGGTHPNRTRACAFLDAQPRPFTPLPTGVMCSMIYGGPETARVVGRWKGTPVDMSFARTNGCETEQWRQYRALFTDPGVVPVRGRVDLGPTCPVQRPGDDCEITGAPATVTATSGTRTRTATSSASGFLLRLPRGTWAVTADAGMHCPTVAVDTRSGPPPLVVLACDTGIR